MTASAQECLACSANINLITAAKLLAKLQQLWCYSVWLRLFWRQLRLTFCTSRWPQSYQSSMSALPPKADIWQCGQNVRYAWCGGAWDFRYTHARSFDSHDDRASSKTLA